MSTTSAVISVSELARRARLAIEKSMPSCWVTGEISNFTRVSSGHWYFTLKDEQCGVKCAFFRNRNQFIDWKPIEGDKVELRAQATLYEMRGDFQLIVDAMRRAGKGSVYEEFLKLKAKLDSEGLFRGDLKLTPPKYPICLGIVTSLQAAALQDVLKTLQNRWPLIRIVIYPTTVQGIEAVATIGLALNSAISRNECDVILLVRGGGSQEDLNAFNDEALARSIAASPIPIITGIGHETDFSIADFVADVRAATPTAAAQLAVPEVFEVRGQIANFHSRIEQCMNRWLYQNMQRLDGLARRISNPAATISQNQNYLTQLAKRIAKSHEHSNGMLKRSIENLMIRLVARAPHCKALQRDIDAQLEPLKNAFHSRFEQRRNRIMALNNSLQQLNPESIISRGYCIALTADGMLIREAKSLTPGQHVALRMRDGHAIAYVESVFSRS